MSYAEARARFFPPTRPIVTFRWPEEKRGLAPSPTEEDVKTAGRRAWSALRREAQRLAVLAIYDEGYQYGVKHVPPFDNADEVILDACRRYGINLRQLTGNGRTRPLVDVRREVSKVMRTRLGMSLPAIGRKLNRDHTSIMNLLGMKKRRASG